MVFLKSSLWAAILAFAIASDAIANTVGFEIEVTGLSSMTADQRDAFARATGVWESLITGYQDTFLAPTPLTIAAVIRPDDGIGGRLGFAAPTRGKFGLERNFLYSARGEMTFDSADVDFLISAGLFDDVVLHEMGHVIGLGTLWDTGFQALYSFGSGQYTGANALAAYQRDYDPAASFVPVELGGGPGTANAHWDELVFGDELMTGFLNGPTYICSVTMGSLQDLGYTVVFAPSTFTGFVSLLTTAFAGLICRRRNSSGRVDFQALS